MKVKHQLLLTALFFLHASSYGQWNNHKGFCGAALKRFQLKEIRPQTSFMHLQEKDTIVDIGASSGWFQGALGATSKIKNIHFLLVDIDSGCLNTRKLSEMEHYYSDLKGDSISYTYDIVINTADSIRVQGQFPKVIVRNTLHEIEGQESFAKQVSDIIRPGGELFIMEVMPTEERKIHGGCHKPLLSFTDINNLFEKHGFVLREKQLQKLKNKTTFQLLRFVKMKTV